MPPKPARNGIFISYSHADKKWLERLKIHLKPLERDHNVIVWTDTKLRSGDKWSTEINKALASARVAILLVSADFLASDFIHTNELPPLLKAASREGTTILPVIVGHSAFSFSQLGHFQAVNNPAQALNSIPEGQADEVFFKLFQRVHGIFVKPTPQRTPAKTAPATLAKTVSRASKPASRPVAKVEDPALTGTKLPRTTKAAVAPKKPTSSSTARSDSALLVKRNGDWDIIPVIQSQIGETLNLTLRPATPTQRSFLISLRQYDNLASIAFRYQTYFCTLKSLQSKTAGKQETWHLDATIGEINRRTEITYNSVTPDMQAQIRARVILLDEASSNNNLSFWGVNNGIEIKESPFPALYQLLGKQPTAFVKAAKLVATWFLQVSNTVEHVLKLSFTLKGQVMTVRFEGKRRAEYQEPPTLIRVEGTCDLARPVAVRTLRLGPLNRY